MKYFEEKFLKILEFLKTVKIRTCRLELLVEEHQKLLKSYVLWFVPLHLQSAASHVTYFYNTYYLLYLISRVLKL